MEIARVSEIVSTSGFYDTVRRDRRAHRYTLDIPIVFYMLLYIGHIFSPFFFRTIKLLPQNVLSEFYSISLLENSLLDYIPLTKS